jgi:hypothetical protein
MAVKLRLAILVGLLSALVSSADESKTNQPSAQKSTQLVPLASKLPQPTLADDWGTPNPIGPDIEPMPDWGRGASFRSQFPDTRPPFLVPGGVTNVALFKKVTSSVKPFANDRQLVTNSLSLITDGGKEAYDAFVAEFRKGVQWVQVDLGTDYEIHAIVCWLDHRPLEQIFRGVIVAVADDESFTNNVRVLFNNDKENLAGLGVGTDKRYFETHLGKLVDAKGTKARYVRVYSNGSNLAGINCFTEIEVWALPTKP